MAYKEIKLNIAMKLNTPEAITNWSSGVSLILVVAVSNLRSWIKSNLR